MDTIKIIRIVAMAAVRTTRPVSATLTGLEAQKNINYTNRLSTPGSDLDKWI